MREVVNLRCFRLLVVAALWPSLAEAQSLEGCVRDARTHAGLPFVKIELLYLGARVELAYSNSDGRFLFEMVEPHDYTMSASLSGYGVATAAVDTRNERRVDLDLTRLAGPVQPSPPVVSVREYMVPKDARKEFDRARKEIGRQDCPRAIQHLENSLRLYDQNAPALNELGNCRRKLGDFQDAEAAFRRAMALSDAAYIVMNLAETYTAQLRFGEAEAILMEAIRKTASSGDAYYALANVYFMQDRLEEAKTAALQADSRSHSIPDLHLLLAKIYLKTSPDEVIPQLQLYLKEAPHGAQSQRVREALKTAKRKGAN